jgi:hypothetical protein
VAPISQNRWRYLLKVTTRRIESLYEIGWSLSVGQYSIWKSPTELFFQTGKQFHAFKASQTELTL